MEYLLQDLLKLAIEERLVIIEKLINISHDTDKTTESREIKAARLL